MARGPLHAVLQHVRRVVAPSAGTVSDRLLLERFARLRDEDAFATLVERHGGLVLGVCRRVLRDGHTADDIFQAAFLVLARQAGSGRWQDSIGPWLHEVAYRLAVKARGDAARRRAVESRWNPPAPGGCLPQAEWSELRAVLDEEVGRLPEKYRAPIVLCYLEGRTNEEAAHHLGWSKTTLRGRLARARDVLRTRLTRRGLALPAGAATAGLAAGSLSAAVPATLTASTTRLAGLLAAPEAGALAQVSGRVAALADGMTRALFMSKLKTAVVVVLAVVVLVAGAGFFVHQALAERPAEERQADGPKAPADAREKSGAPAGPRTRLDQFGDPLPADVLARIGTVRLRHGSIVTQIVFAPDGKRLASAAHDGFVHVWEAATGKELLRIETSLSSDYVGSDAALSLAFAPDGKTLAAARMNRPACLWDVVTGKELYQLGGDQHRAERVTFSPDGKKLAYGGGRTVGGDDPVIVLADAATGKDLWRLVGHAGKVQHFQFSAGGKTLISRGGDGTVRLWDTATGKQLHRFEGTVSALAPDGKTLAYRGKDKSIHLCDPATGKELRQLPEQPDDLSTLVFSAEGKTLAASSRAGRVLGAWDAATGKPLYAHTFEGKREQVTRILFTSDGMALVSGHEDGSVRFWDAATGAPGRRFHPHDDGILALVLSPDGKTLASSCHSHYAGEFSVRLLDVATGKPLVPGVGPESGIAFVAFSLDGESVATANWDRPTRVWQAATGKELVQVQTYGPLAFLPDGKTLITGGWSDGQVRLWELATGREFRHFQAHAKAVHCMALATDGKMLASAEYNGALQLLDLATGRPVHEFGGKQPSHAYRLALSPDTRFLASVHEDHSITLWDVATEKPVHRYPGHDSVGSIAFSPDGTLLAATSSRQIQLWDVATGKEVRRLPGHGDLMDVVAFSPDSKTLVWGGQHETVVRCWEVRTGQERRQFPGHQGHITCAAFSPEGTRLATGSADATVLIWDVAGRGLPPVRLGAGQPTALWNDLAGEQADDAYRAMRALRQSPEQAIALIQQHLRPVPIIDAKRLAGLLRDLDGDEFTVREQAGRELEKLGEAAEPALRNALAGKPSVEVRRRVAQFLEKLDGPARLRNGRALEVLEWLGDQEAQRLLRALAEGAPEAWLTQQAKQSLERLARRSEK